MRPVIAICGPDHGGLTAWLLSSWAVRLAGGRPIRVSPRRGPPAQRIAGLILAGGADVGDGAEAPAADRRLRPLPRNSKGHPALSSYLLGPLILVMRRLLSVKHGVADAERDALESLLLRRAWRERTPILGICRGAQLINVIRGGTLHRDLMAFYAEVPNPSTVLPRKRVRVEPQSHLARALGVSECAVNSLHRNAVARVGDGLRVVAREGSGLVQAIESVDHPFCIGVQWHPEYLPQRREQRRLISRFVAAARRPEGADEERA